MIEIPIRTEMIRLGQLLKLAAVVESGSEAKVRVQAGEVQVNGEVETRRGRQLRPGDEVRIGQEHLRIILDSNS
ncbi:RNA-binding S4 domain-containing protein [Thermodesulfobacteriota bacterium]